MVTVGGPRSPILCATVPTFMNADHIALQLMIRRFANAKGELSARELLLIAKLPAKKSIVPILCEAW